MCAAGWTGVGSYPLFWRPILLIFAVSGIALLVTKQLPWQKLQEGKGKPCKPEPFFPESLLTFASTLLHSDVLKKKKIAKKK
jgi:hypothetical protein